jgi:hypothetical protein
MNWLQRLDFGEDIFERGIRVGKPSNRFVDFKILTSWLYLRFTACEQLPALEIPPSAI